MPLNSSLVFINIHFTVNFVESLLPPLPITERGKTTILGSDINSKKVIYAHGKSVYIRNLSVHDFLPKSLS